MAALGDREAVLLGRHGVLAVGATPAHALAVCAAVEQPAQRLTGMRDATHTTRLSEREP